MSGEQPGVQAFRQGNVVKLLGVISSDVPGQPSFVFLEDVQYLFPDAKYFQVGDVMLAFMRDANHRRYIPERIPCRSDLAVIDILTHTESPSQTLTPATTTSSSLVSAAASANSTTTSNIPSEPQITATLSLRPSLVSMISPPIPPRPTFYIPAITTVSGEGLTSSTATPTSPTAAPTSSKAAPIPARTSSSSTATPTSSKAAPTPMRTSSSSTAAVAAAAPSPAVKTTPTTAAPIRHSATQGPDVRAITPVVPTPLPEPVYERFSPGRSYIQARHFGGITFEGMELVRKVKELESASSESPSHISATPRLTTAFLMKRPRLLMVRQTTSYNDMKRDKYMVQFVCEGEGHVHLPDHIGYQIKENLTFFDKYRPILQSMTTLLQERLKNEAREPGAGLDLQTTLKAVNRTAEILVMRGKLKAARWHTPRVWAQYELKEFLKTGTGVKGLDLKDLFEYLEVGPSDDFLGGLSRCKIWSGEYKWLCKEHVRQEAMWRLGVVARTHNGKLDESLKTIEVIVKSDAIAADVYEHIVAAETIRGLVLTLNYDLDYKSLLTLQDFMSKVDLSTLTLNLANYSGKESDGGAQRYKPILEMVQDPSLHTLTLKGLPSDFFVRSGLEEGRYKFSNLDYLRIDHDISQIKDLTKFKTMLLAATELSTLIIQASELNFVETFNLIQEARTGIRPSMRLQFRSETPSAEVLLEMVLPLRSAQATSNSPPPKLMDMEQFFEGYGSRIQKLQYTGISNSIIEALDKGTRKESNLAQLTLWLPQVDSDQGMASLIKVVSQNQLRRLQCDISKPAQLAILQKIQWSTLHHLMVNADISPKGMERILTEVYTVVKAESHKPNAKIALQEFIFKSSAPTPNKEVLQVLKKVLKRLTELREFSLNLRCSVEVCGKLVKYILQTSTRLERLTVNGEGYSNGNVLSVLNQSQIVGILSGSSGGGGGLTAVFRKMKSPAGSMALKTLVIRDADISTQLVAQVKAKGIQLRNKVLV